MDKTVSILVRTHNEAPFLKRTLAAIADQKTGREVEVIVCDDGSTDETHAVLESAGVRQMARPEGEYRPGRTLNAMVRAAKGELIVFNNADAVPLDENWLENLVAPLVEGRADATFANQLPRPDATPLVRKDSERAFGDGSVSKNWPRFFSLASSAAVRSDLMEHPFDETLFYSEDIEWVNRRKGFRKVYVPGARVEHSHNYTEDELKRRFYGEGYAMGQIFGDKPSGRVRTLLRAMAESIRDFKYLASRPGEWGSVFASPRRRWLQRRWCDAGVADYFAGKCPRFVKTTERGGGILLTGVYPKYHGGLERFAGRLAALLRGRGFSVTMTGDPPDDASGYSLVVMNKVPPTVGALRRLKAQCGERLRFYAHDHELYCLRRHYYCPTRRNCQRAYSWWPCRLCAAVTRPGWVVRALTRRIAAFLAEMRGVKTFVPSSFTRDALLRNGFRPDMITVLPPYFRDASKDASKASAPRPDSSSKALRLVFMGQLVAGKGVAVLIEAAKMLDIPYTLTIVGGGKDEKKLMRLAAGRSEIVFTGYVTDTTPYLREADAVVFPSLWQEPYGLTGLEGYEHGVPAVGFDTGGVRDWLIDGETGVLVKEQTPQALAQGLKRIADPAFRARVAQGAYRFVREHYSADAFLESLGVAQEGGAE